MSITPDSLYELLPAIYRLRDAAQGDQLKALISVLAGQAVAMEDDIAGLYDNWFIETCAEWVVPYIGDLLGVNGLYDFGADTAFSQRARVANTIAYRRRKGTATMLEQLARDTTGWNARVVEFFELLEWTQYYNHPRLHNHRTPDIRDTNRLELLDTAFDTIAHTGDVRRIVNGRGTHNISNIGIYLWRLQSYYIHRSECRPIAAEGTGRFTFNPRGLDAALFNRPQTETEITHLAEERNVPGMLRRRALWDDLESGRQAIAEGHSPDYTYFSDAGPESTSVFEIFPGRNATPIPPEQVLICNLADWHVPLASKTYNVVQDDGASIDIVLPIAVAVDPLLGRMTFPASATPETVLASYAYGFPGDIAGGPYNRQSDLTEAMKRTITWTVVVNKELPASASVFNNLIDAVMAWNAQPAGITGMIAITDNSSYDESLISGNKIVIPDGSQLILAAAGIADETSAEMITADECRAHIIGDISITGSAPTSSVTPGELIIDGLILEGKTTVLVGNLGLLRIGNSTLPSGIIVKTSATPGKQNADLRLSLDGCVTGPLQVPAAIESVALKDSVLAAIPVDGNYGTALGADLNTKDPGPKTVIERCTVLGWVFLEELELASESIFTEAIIVTRRQSGCARFSYLAPGSVTPRRYRCQPDLALKDFAERHNLKTVSDIPPSEAERIRRRIVPSFTTLALHSPALAQLHRNCADEIISGAENGSEMGVWCFLKQPQRLANLRASLDEYLRFGLEAGPILVT